MTALILRIIACVAMVMDHIGVITDSLPLRMVGRISFPLFLYLIYNGYKYSSNRGKYALRLGVFALISQIPYSLFISDTVSYKNGNVFFTLLVALLCIWATDTLLNSKKLKPLFFTPALSLFLMYHFGILRSEYGAKAMLMCLVFLLFDGKGLAKKILTVLGCFVSVYYSQIAIVAIYLLCTIIGREYQLPQFDTWEYIQICSLLALPLIFAYNGKKGKTPQNKTKAKILQYSFYIFYPAQYMILWAIMQFA